MQGTVLMVSAAEGVERCGAAVARQLGLTVEIAGNRRAALAAVRRGEYLVVLLRREHELTLARRIAVTALHNALNGSVTGLLLESELALREPSVPAELAPKLRHLVELAGAIREQLRPGV